MASYQCASCQDTGKSIGTRVDEECRVCNGTGRFLFFFNCEICNGKGYNTHYIGPCECTGYNGSGCNYVDEEKGIPRADYDPSYPSGSYSVHSWL